MMCIIVKNNYLSDFQYQPIGSEDRAAMPSSLPPPHTHTFMGHCLQDILIEQSGFGYSNKAVTVFREAV